MAKNINKSVFDDSTQLKLGIFGECFEEWLPVFNNDQFTSKVYVFDFFAGSGTDTENNMGSPLILLDKAKGKNRKYGIFYVIVKIDKMYDFSLEFSKNLYF